MSTDHARHVRAFLDEVCADLERRHRPRTWREYALAAGLPIAVGLGMGIASCGGESESGLLYGAPFSGEVLCDDRKDNDRDGKIDCADSDCARAPVCVGHESSCSDGKDNDGDGLIDCGDPDCMATNCGGDIYGVPIEHSCIDELDNDGDDLVDCADSDCAQSKACNPDAGASETVCTDQVDNDGDGKIDCADEDCAISPSCKGLMYGVPIEWSCTDKIDNDADGEIDCLDSDCAGDPACK